ncbi:hypothetical protein [Pedobacter glucosidilyticus]|uniref:hypothetical protein n=1 Tax=Pedobacter glucosidilyticus TaxID=1122941 RepID=UPI000684E2A8|nr:hypothetical protein [Pedobacter glucosidilyticus]
MRCKIYLSVIVLWFLFTYHAAAQRKQNRKGNNEIGNVFKNDITVPSKFYMLSGIQNDLFVEPIIKRWRPYDDVVRFSGTANYSRRLQRVASIVNPIDSTSIIFNLINTQNFDTLKSIKTTLSVAQPGVGNDSVKVAIIGDSFTNGAFFKDALLIKGYVPKIKLIGLRDVIGFKGQFDEGRGGWTLKRYFSPSMDRIEPYNGFWQPHGNYKYWGATHFWQLANAISQQPDANWTVEETYYAGRYTTQALKFDTKTGLKINPQTDDIMFDNETCYFIKFNGKNWEKVRYEDFDWAFNYPKYLKMWNLETPQILAEFLGLNDFRDVPQVSQIDFSEWNNQILALKKSYQEAAPQGKFVLMIPASTCGLLDNTAGDFTIKQNAAMWELRKNIINNFDHCEEEGIYIVDAGIAIDGVNGYDYTQDTTYTKPFTSYQGKNYFEVQTKNPHPYSNYATMGLSLAAFIQRFR